MDIEALFNQHYDGFRAVKLRSASKAIAVENALRSAGRSYKTKIMRNKKRGREFVVMLV